MSTDLSKKKVSVALVGDAGAGYREQAAREALDHCSGRSGAQIVTAWFETGEFAGTGKERKLGDFDGVWIVPGSPYKSLEGVLAAIRFAREQGLPLLGTCAGFQHLVLEYLHNVVGKTTAVHAEYHPAANDAAISRLSCSLVGAREKVTFDPNSLVARIYGRTSTEEEFRCNYGLNASYLSSLKSTGLRIVGWDENGETRAVELANHRFFVGTLFIPQYSSTASSPHPLVCGFLAAAAEAQRLAEISRR